MNDAEFEYQVMRKRLLEELPQLLAELLRRAGPAALPAGGNTGTGYIPANGSVTTPKLADGSVTPAKLSFDPATQAELEAHAQLVASVAQLGHVKIDGTTIGINAQGQLYVVAGGSNIPPPPDTYVYLTDPDGVYLTDSDNAYLWESAI